MGFDCEPECLDLLPGHQFVLFSDGLNEARNLHGEMLGVEGVEAVFAGQGASLMERLVGGVGQHLGSHEADDDVTIAVISPDKLLAEGLK